MTVLELYGKLAQVDLIDLNGPLYSGFDNRVAALRLVQKGLCDAALFDPSGAQLVSSKNTTTSCCIWC